MSAAQTPPAFAPTPSALGSSANGMWILAGVAILFVGLIVVWLGSLGSPDLSVSASPGRGPKVRVSPFDGMDDSQAVQLQLQRQDPEPAPTAPPAGFSVQYVIPTKIEVGRPMTLGLFGDGFPEDAKVSIAVEGVAILSTHVRSPEHIEIQIQADQAHEQLDIVVEDSEGARVAVALTVHER